MPTLGAAVAADRGGWGRGWGYRGFYRGGYYPAYGYGYGGCWRTVRVVGPYGWRLAPRLGVRLAAPET